MSQRRTPLLLLMIFLSWLAPAIAQPLWSWDEDARWELRQEPTSNPFQLGQLISDFGIEDNAQEMVILPQGILVRHRDRRAVNLTVLENAWSLLRNNVVVGNTGADLAAWEAKLGLPRAIYVNPGKMAQIHYYRASLADIGLMVAGDKVHSVMLVEPGYLLPALERTGYLEQKS